MSKLNSTKKCAVIGDVIWDTVFTSEERDGIPRTKETLFTNSLEEVVATGLGGSVYLQQALRLLFHTHFPASKPSSPAECDKLFNEVVLEQPTGHTTSTNHWRVAKRPKFLGKNNEAVYRAIDKIGRSEIDIGTATNPLPDPTIFKGGVPDLLLISDHARSIRYLDAWSKGKYKKWLTAPSGTDNYPRRILHLANRLPSSLLGKPGDRTEHLWDVLLSPEGRSSTMIVTSLDRLRMEGANISRRISWDRTIDEFRRELKHFAPLKKLGQFKHLVVRCGIVGAIHCYRYEENEWDIKLAYDPNATQLIFREEALQGHAFGTRSLLPASIAFHILLKLMGAISEDSLPRYDRGPRGTILRGIRDSISLSQTIYSEGFGKNLQEVKDFIRNQEDERNKALLPAYSTAHRCDLLPNEKSGANKPEPRELPKSKWFSHIVRFPSDNTHSNGRWDILEDNLYGTIKRGELIAGIANPETQALALAVHRRLNQLRKLRMARAIVAFGPEAAINNTAPPDRMLRRVEDGENHLKYLLRLHQNEHACDATFRQRSMGEVADQTPYLKACLLPEWRIQAPKDFLFDCDKCESNSCDNVFCKNSPTHEGGMSLCGPVARFGDLTAIGPDDSQTYSSIRNMLSLHLSTAATKPLCVGVFGSPGNGKSFGVTALAKFLGGESIKPYTCNLSQLSSKSDLDREFFKIAQILLDGKTPLVFFDEFDCKLNGQPLYWLRFFLEPMNDGKYRYPDGMFDLGNSIFVFAGGTQFTFKDFQNCLNKDLDEKKAAKLPDFISRLNGHIDIAGVNAPQKDLTGVGIPYLRRALILRGALEREKSILDDYNVAQIDRNVIDAFLRVPEYYHGARSITAVLRICKRWDKRIEKSSIPYHEQLSVHLKADAFKSLIAEPGKHPIAPVSATALRRLQTAARNSRTGRKAQ